MSILNRGYEEPNCLGFGPSKVYLKKHSPKSINQKDQYYSEPPEKKLPSFNVPLSGKEPAIYGNFSSSNKTLVFKEIGIDENAKVEKLYTYKRQIFGVKTSSKNGNKFIKKWYVHKDCRISKVFAIVESNKIKNGRLKRKKDSVPMFKVKPPSRWCINEY